MNMPWYQTTFRWVGYAVFGAIALGSFLDALSNAITVVTPLATLGGTILIFCFWAAIEVWLLVRPMKWVIGGGREVSLKRLGPQPRLAFLGAIALLWFPRLGDATVKERSEEPTVTPSQEVTTQIPQFVLWVHNKSKQDIVFGDKLEIVITAPMSTTHDKINVRGYAEMIAGDGNVGITQLPKNYRVPIKGNRMFGVQLMNQPKYIDYWKLGDCKMGVIMSIKDGRRLYRADVPFCANKDNLYFYAINIL